MASEALLFAGMVSGYLGLRSHIHVWPPPGQPRLPVEATAFNTLVLLASGVIIYLSQKPFNDPFQKKSLLRHMQLAIGLGAAFLLLQGYEWFNLLRFGMGITENVYGGLFYMIVGFHALHVIIALLLHSYVYFAIRAAKKPKDHAGKFYVSQMFWMFVVVVWPFLYYTVYIL